MLLNVPVHPSDVLMGICNKSVNKSGITSEQGKTVSGHPNLVSLKRKDMEKLGEDCRRATTITPGLENKKNTARHKKPIA